jgi:tripartite-type tricarboxylate transporter receptor subunit TctC
VAPDIPTVAESGVPGFSVSGWWGILAPAQTPQAIVAQAQKDIARVLASREVQERFSNDGIEAIGSSAEEFGAFIRDEMNRWARVVKDAGIRPD